MEPRTTIPIQRHGPRRLRLGLCTLVLRDKPTMVIIFTDLGSRSYGDEPDYPVLWASSVPAKNPYDKTPPFGDVVEVEI